MYRRELKIMDRIDAGKLATVRVMQFTHTIYYTLSLLDDFHTQRKPYKKGLWLLYSFAKSTEVDAANTKIIYYVCRALQRTHYKTILL